MSDNPNAFADFMNKHEKGIGSASFLEYFAKNFGEAPYLENAEIFFFGWQEKQIYPPVWFTPSAPLDLPFPVIYFECSDQVPMMFLDAFSMGESFDCYVCGIVCEELSPGDYLFRTSSITGRDRVTFHLIDSKHGSYRGLYWFVKTQMDRLKTDDVGEEKTRIKIKSRSQEGTKNFFIRKIIHIKPKGSEYPKESGESRKINWSHKWNVRGHWRKCQMIGKDREGNYTVKGYSWVRPHVKGEGPLIKKTRVVHLPNNKEGERA